MEVFNLLHISDLHIGITSPVYREKLADPLILNGIVNFARRPSVNSIIDAIIISGDLANSGYVRNDLIGAAGYVTGSLSLKRIGFEYRENLANVGKPIFIVPGNHDRYTTDYLTRLPGNHDFDFAFERHWDIGEYVKVNYLPKPGGNGLVIISADFTLTLEDKHLILTLGHYGQGRVCKERLKRLLELTQDVRGEHPGAAITWMIHFAPNVQSEFKRVVQDRLDAYTKNLPNFKRFKIPIKFLELTEDKRLLQAAEKERIKVIFCGHTHVPKNYSVGKEKDTKVVCAGTSTLHNPQEKYPATIHLRRLFAENSQIVDVKHIDFVWNTEDYPRFVPIPHPTIQ